MKPGVASANGPTATLVAGEQSESALPNPADTLLELDHLGLIVSELAEGRRFLTAALGITRWTAVIEDPNLHVAVQFGSMPGGGLNYELIAPHGDASPIANALRAGKHILNHLAYLTSDLHASAERLREAGCYPAGEPQPAVAYGGSRVQFWMSPLRFVIELVEKPGHRHDFSEDEFPEDQSQEPAR